MYRMADSSRTRAVFEKLGDNLGESINFQFYLSPHVFRPIFLDTYLQEGVQSEILMTSYEGDGFFMCSFMGNYDLFREMNKIMNGAEKIPEMSPRQDCDVMVKDDIQMVFHDSDDDGEEEEEILYHRGKVLDESEKPSVYFVDFGYSKTVYPQNVFSLPCDLALIKPQAV